MVGLFALSEWNAKSFSVLMKLKEINDDIPKILEKINITGIAISVLYEVFCEKDIVRTSILIKGLAFRESLRKRLKNAINVANGNYDILTILFYLYKKKKQLYHKINYNKTINLETFGLLYVYAYKINMKECVNALTEYFENDAIKHQIDFIHQVAHDNKRCGILLAKLFAINKYTSSVLKYHKLNANAILMFYILVSRGYINMMNKKLQEMAANLDRSHYFTYKGEEYDIIKYLRKRNES